MAQVLHTLLRAHGIRAKIEKARTVWTITLASPEDPRGRLICQCFEAGTGAVFANYDLK